MELELRKRLIHLTPVELQLAANGVMEERTAMAWLAALKSSTYIFSFAAEVLRGKLSSLDPVLRASDYETFFNNQSASHPEILATTVSTRAKVRSTLLKMVWEAGLGMRSGRELLIQRPMVVPSVHSAIIADSPRWLAGFLVPGSEIS